LNDWQVWQCLAVYFAASIAITIYLIRKDPAPLARRMSGAPFAEKEPTQKIISWRSICRAIRNFSATCDIGWCLTSGERLEQGRELRTTVIGAVIIFLMGTD
jgi:hypothetical protein